MCGFRDGALHGEMKNRFGPSPLFRQTTPARIAVSGSAVATRPLAHEIDVGVVFIRGPVAMEIVEECRPVMLKVASTTTRSLFKK